MSVFGTKNLMNVFVGKDIAGNAISTITTDLINQMADGQVIAVGTPSTYQGTYPAGTGFSEIVIPDRTGGGTNLGAYTSFRLVEKQNGVLNYGPKVKVSDVDRKSTRLNPVTL